MIFLSKPSVYNLPGTWEKQPDAIIPHLNLTPDQGFIVFFVLVVVGLVAYGLYLTVGAGKKALRAVSYTHLRAHETGRNLVCRCFGRNRPFVAVSYTHLTLPTSDLV